jgi:hypothetical protein
MATSKLSTRTKQVGLTDRWKIPKNNSAENGIALWDCDCNKGNFEAP